MRMYDVRNWLEPLLVIVGPHRIDLGEDAKLRLIIRSNKPIKKIHWIKIQDEDRTEIKLWENQKPELDPEYTFPCKTIEENGCYLELKEVTMKDDAKYEAVVQTVVGKTTSTECKLMILKAPPRVKVFTDGSKRTIKANIKSNEEVQLLTWQRMYHGSFQDIDIVHRKYIGSTFDKENPKLEIRDLTAEDDTLYRLIVKNTAGECTSNEVHLVLKDGN
ncbi:uncharacterized protein LOC134255335 [Saccostrea cucullata]|uniref:uncharacterized protein LOC134255335 n=1 Tax=Saccostrea cuccullata TaxID=36930 RepID=UPI002ED44D7D